MMNFFQKRAELRGIDPTTGRDYHVRFGTRARLEEDAALNRALGEDYYVVPEIGRSRSEPAALAPSAKVTWPKDREVARIADMHPTAHLRLGFDSDNDVFVEVWDGEQSASVEFCNGGGGGGRSGRTRLALVALMVAMEADNAETPHKDWRAERVRVARQRGTVK